MSLFPAASVAYTSKWYAPSVRPKPPLSYVTVPSVPGTPSLAVQLSGTPAFSVQVSVLSCSVEWNVNVADVWLV